MTLLVAPNGVRDVPAPAERTVVGRILLVGAEPMAVCAETDRLRHEGFDVEVSPSAAAAAAALLRFRPALVVLHAPMPDGRPLDALDSLRSIVDLPFVLSDALGEELDRIAALDAGMDDVVPRPASPAELVARVRAVLRRRSRPSAEGEPPDDGTLCVGEVTVNEASHRAWCRGRPVVLTALEHRLLAYFLRHAGTALSRERLLEDVWGYTIGGGATVTVHVRRLREKIEPSPAEPTLIRTVWGVGYRYET